MRVPHFVVSAVDLFRIDTGRLPTQDEGLDVLVHAPADANDWLGPYLAKDSVPLDPWGHAYVYDPDQTGASFRIVSYGSYGKPGGTGADQPISSDPETPQASQDAHRSPDDQAGASGSVAQPDTNTASPSN